MIAEAVPDGEAGGGELARWRDENRSVLTAELTRVRRQLQRAAGEGIDDDDIDDSPVSTSLRAEMASPPAIDVLCDALSLGAFDRDVVLLCAGHALDADVRALCSKLRGRGDGPSFSLALSALDEPVLSAALPQSPLRRFAVVHLSDPANPFTGALRLDEPILHFLVGLGLQGGEEGFTPVVPSAHTPVPSHRHLADTLALAWERMAAEAAGVEEVPVIALRGPDLGSREAVAQAMADRLGLSLFRTSLAELPPLGPELELLCRRWNRICAILPAALLANVDVAPVAPAAAESADWALRRLSGLLLLSGKDAVDKEQRPRIQAEVARPLPDEQRALWDDSVAHHGGDPAPLSADLDQLTGQFDLNPAQIDGTVLKGLAAADEGEDLGVALRRACRQSARGPLDALATRISVSPEATIILPEEQAALLDAIRAQVRASFQVYARWGFSARNHRGLGISALFYGISGTGKTTAAEVLARDLDLDLYRVDIASIVSKYIGETEKNLREIFDRAEGAGAILLFDEADALFGRRSEVKDSHDRYANIEVGYLLQRMETYRGLCVLTTNLREALDEAFARRIRFIVEFPFPGRAERRAIWEAAFPRETPTGSLAFDKLARLNISGGHIHNIALNAAFIAANQSEPVEMQHLLLATQREFTKLGRTLSASDTADWT